MDFCTSTKNFNGIRQTKLWSKDQILFSKCVLHFPLCKNFLNKEIRKYIISENWLELTRKFMDPFKKITYFHRNAKPPTFHEMALFIKVKPPLFLFAMEQNMYKQCLKHEQIIRFSNWHFFLKYFCIKWHVDPYIHEQMEPTPSWKLVTRLTVNLYYR